MFSFCAGMASAIAMAPMTNAAMRATLTSSFSRGLAALPHRGVEVVGHRGRRGEGQASDHREDRREGDRGDEGQQDRAACRAVAATNLLGEEWRGQVAGGRRHLAARPGVEQCGRAEAQHQRHQVEAADDPDGPVDRPARVLGRRHRVEADQDVRQSRRTEDQGQAEGQEVDLAGGGGAVLQPGLEERLALAGVLAAAAEQLAQVEVELREHQDGDQDRAADEEHRLDDLHPGGALHAADGDVEDHQRRRPRRS